MVIYSVERGEKKTLFHRFNTGQNNLHILLFKEKNRYYLVSHLCQVKWPH